MSHQTGIQDGWVPIVEVQDALVQARQGGYHSPPPYHHPSH